MDQTAKVTWLKRVLLFKVLACLFVWGLPTLLGPAALLSLFNVSIPADPFFLRMFGAVITGVAVLYWFAYRDPLRNKDIIRYGVVDNTLSTLAILAMAVTGGLSSIFFWISAVLTAFFAVAFWRLMPGE